MICSFDERVVARYLPVLDAPAGTELNSRRTVRFSAAEDKLHYSKNLRMCESRGGERDASSSERLTFIHFKMPLA
jgi:hypothetical protein